MKRENEQAKRKKRTFARGAAAFRDFLPVLPESCTSLFFSCRLLGGPWAEKVDSPSTGGCCGARRAGGELVDVVGVSEVVCDLLAGPFRVC